MANLQTKKNGFSNLSKCKLSFTLHWHNVKDNCYCVKFAPRIAFVIFGGSFIAFCPFAIPDTFLLSKSTGYNPLPFLTSQITLWAVVKHPPWGGIPPMCIFEIKLSVGLCAVVCFFMLFAGRKTADFWAFYFCIAYKVIIARDNLKN